MRTAILVTLLAGLPAALPARAADTTAEATDPFAWEAPDTEAQLAADTTTIPAGKGAVFVPRMTDPNTTEEPAVSIHDGKRVIAEGEPGERIVVPPGRYEIVAGSGAEVDALRIPVEVTAGDTAVVPPSWGVLRIEVVDERMNPLRRSYEIIRSDTREVTGTGYGADTLSGERLEAWTLRPGLYRVVRPGSNYRTRTDFATVYVPEGGLVRFRLVLDDTTGDYRGSGVIMPGEFATVESASSPWSATIVAGLDASFTQSSNVPGQSDSTVLGGQIFAEGHASWTREKHRVSLLGQVEEGTSRTRYGDSEALPWLKTSDRLRADLLYTWLATDRVGPYVRAGGTSRALATQGFTTEDVVVAWQATDGTVTTESIAANDSWDLADPLQPTILREGAGANVAVARGRRFRLDWRVGPGLRQNLYGGSWVEDDDPDTPEIEYVQVDSFSQAGIESTVRGIVRPLPMVAWFTDLEAFAPFDDMGNPAFEWSNTVSFSLNEYLSLNYVARVASEPQVSSQVQLDQAVLLRASWSLL